MRQSLKGAIDAGLSGVYMFTQRPRQKSQSISKDSPVAKGADCIAVGQQMKRRLWSRHLVCRIWENVLWFA